MKRILSFFVVLMILSTGVFGASLKECLRENQETKWDTMRDCNDDYRHARNACNTGYLYCKWDYWMCVVNLNPSVFTIGCAQINLDCRQEFHSCRADVKDTRDRCVQTAEMNWRQARHECKW